MTTALEQKEHEFALKVRHALDENIAKLPEASLDKLASARRVAIARKKSARVAVAVPVMAPAFAGAAGQFNLPAEAGKRGRFSRLALA